MACSMQVFVTKTDDDAVVLPALQDPVVESLVVQFLGYVLLDCVHCIAGPWWQGGACAGLCMRVCAVMVPPSSDVCVAVSDLSRRWSSQLRRLSVHSVNGSASGSCAYVLCLVTVR